MLYDPTCVQDCLLTDDVVAVDSTYTDLSLPSNWLSRSFVKDSALLPGCWSIKQEETCTSTTVELIAFTNHPHTTSIWDDSPYIKNKAFALEDNKHALLNHVIHSDINAPKTIQLHPSNADWMYTGRLIVQCYTDGGPSSRSHGHVEDITVFTIVYLWLTITLTLLLIYILHCLKLSPVLYKWRVLFSCRGFGIR